MSTLLWVLAVEAAAAAMLVILAYFAPEGYEPPQGLIRSQRKPAAADNSAPNSPAEPRPGRGQPIV